MSRRIEIELTSSREDATFTWRAAGAREPKGVVAATTLPQGASVGDRFKVELDSGLDGTEITQVIRDRAEKAGPERLEFLRREIPDDALVTSRLASRSKAGPKKGRGESKNRPPRSAKRDDKRATNHGDRRSGEQHDRKERPKRDDRPRREKPAAHARPQVPRLRPGNTNRQAFLATLAEEERPIADKLAHGGLPGLRQAIEADNAKRKEQGQPEVPSAGLIAMGEKLLPRLQDAEWLDRAQAALAAVDTVDLRDLRSVVVASDGHARTDETRELAATLRTRLAERVDAEHVEWLADLERGLDEKRIVRVLNLSSRPPKAGSPLPSALSERMVAATNAALEPTTLSDRWITILDALSFAPFRNQVVPVGVPENPDEVLVAKVRKLAERLPNIATAFGISSSK